MNTRFYLQEHTKLPKCNWPQSLLSYSFETDEGADTDNFCICTTSNEMIPCQISDLKVNNEGKKLAYVNFISDLKAGEKKEFFLCDNKKDLHIKKCIYNINLKNKNLFEIICGEQKIKASLDCDKTEYVCLEKGDVYEKYLIKCFWNSGELYELEIKLINELPFFELKENIIGFNDDGKHEMILSFENFDFRYRKSMNRPKEKIDRYADEDGILPVKVYSYDSWVNWSFSRCVDFYGSERNAGIFIRDNNEWDDGKYNLWTADSDFGIYFSYDEEELKWHFPLKNGKRFTGITVFDKIPADEFFTENLWSYYGLLNLDKVKDWKLDWNYVQPEKSRFFSDAYRKENNCIVCGIKADAELKEDALKEIMFGNGRRLTNSPDNPEPVPYREVTGWTVLYDLTAYKMSYENAKRCAAVIALFACIAMDENFMPTRNMLAGHPNFLMEITSAVGFAAALFPEHPDRDKWIKYCNKVFDLNMNYHIRPDIEKWKAKGGRATEDIGCYNFASLEPAMRFYTMFKKCGYELFSNTNKAEKWLNWMMNIVSAPIDGKRLFMPQGAHSSGLPGDEGYIRQRFCIYELAKILSDECPKTATKYISLYNAEKGLQKNDIWSELSDKVNSETELSLKSEKFTGYGCVLRNGFGTKEEISVHIQQLDRGPNYRWGCFRNTGNGSIYYCAENKRYSFNSPEGIGDLNGSAVQDTCGFGVLDEYTYRNIGYNELKEPLINLGFIQSVKLNAEEKIKRLYKYRNVMLVESDYIVVYDAVRDISTRGRFVWFVQRDEEFPEILQLKPGVKAVNCNAGKPVEVAEYDKDYTYECYDEPCHKSKGVAYDGFGNFLTVVSHKKEITAEKKSYGAKINVSGRIDYVFCDNANTKYNDEEIGFVGRDGIVSINDEFNFKCALINGEEIRYRNCHLLADPNISISLICKNGEYSGKVCVYEKGFFEICTNKITQQKIMNPGEYRWFIKENKIIFEEEKEDYQYSEDTTFRRDTLEHEYGFCGYNFDRKREILEY